MAKKNEHKGLSTTLLGIFTPGTFGVLNDTKIDQRPIMVITNQIGDAVRTIPLIDLFWIYWAVVESRQPVRENGKLLFMVKNFQETNTRNIGKDKICTKPSRGYWWLCIVLLSFSVCFQNCNSQASAAHASHNLAGTTWISSTFLSKLKQTKNSNIAAQGINMSMLEFSDSTHCKVIWNFYEGTDFSYSIRQDTVELSDVSNRRYGQIVFVVKDSVLIDSKKQSFTKCQSSSVIESILFAGRYRADSTQQLVTFLPNGSVQNFNNYHSYTCEFRTALPDSSLNILYLDDLKFAYQFQENGDLEIFELVCSDISDEETCVQGKRIALLRRYD